VGIESFRRMQEIVLLNLSTSADFTFNDISNTHLCVPYILISTDLIRI
jgi:hypothetical protein